MRQFTTDIAAIAPALPTQLLGKQTVANMVFAIFICGIPFVQLGVSYYASVASVMATMIFFAWCRYVISGVWRAKNLGIVTVLMAFSVFGFPSEHVGQDLLRVLRESSIWLVMVALLREFRRKPPFVPSDIVLPMLFVVVAAEATLTLIQRYGYSRGQYFGIPVEYFSTDGNTIPGALDLFYSELRPSGTFQEPSYLAFILISIIVMITPKIGKVKIATFAASLAVITGLLSGSLSFIMSLTVIGASYYFQGHASVKLRHLLPIAGLMFIIAAATTDLAGVLERAGHGGSAFGDLSIFSRIVAPVVVLPQYMLAEPFGVAFSKLGDALYPFMLNTSVDPLEITHTALFNVFFEFGFIGIPIILSLFFAARRPILICYLFLSCCFNGSLLAPDKFAVIAFAFLVHESMRAAKPTLRDDKITKLAPSLA